jgi:dTMP kinase
LLLFFKKEVLALPFLVLEGGEGSGKTSACAALVDHLRSRGLDVLATREPGGTPEGLALRAMLLSDNGYAWDAGAEMLLMVAARIQHVKRVIAPALAAGRVVVCDRFVGSTLAYQGAGRGVPTALIADLHAHLVDDLQPDLTIFLDIDPRVGLARSVRRLSAAAEDEGRFEALDLAFHERVRGAFLEQARGCAGRSFVLDAGRDLPAVQDAVNATVLAWLGSREKK